MIGDLIGRSKWELDTPVLFLDLDIVERNILTIASFCRQAGVKWRPHTKGQKVPALAHREVAAGAIGITCAKLSEAEVMAAAGISNILIANQVVGAAKMARLVSLARRAEAIVAVDSLQNAEEMASAATRAGVRIGVLVEVNVGMNRAGVEPGQAALLLSEKVHALSGLRYMGLMGWEGHCGRIEPPERKKQAIQEAVGRLVATAQLCRDRGLPVDIVSCGGTITFQYTVHVPGITEVQAGGAIFGDVLYESCGLRHPFALTVMSTVTSRPTRTRILVDAGRKAMSVDVALPRPKTIERIASATLSAEHGRIELQEPSETPRIGDKVEWIVGYGDTTVCLHDAMVGTRADRVEVVWPILGRGKLT